VGKFEAWTITIGLMLVILAIPTRIWRLALLCLMLPFVAVLLLAFL
jgi:hypothetical protein